MDLLLPTRCAGCDTLHRGLLCPACTPGGIHHAPLRVPGLAGCITLGGYDGPLGRAVRRCKTQSDRHLALTLAATLARRVDARGFDAIVAAPTPWTRRWRRGFHLAALLARAVAQRSGVPECRALTSRPGPRQSASPAPRARRKNLQGRVRSRRPVPGRVLLIDDVVTTGATAQACVRELLGDASQEVWLATLCAVRRRPAPG
ncbi:MAG: putative amidophosphoribosyltransferase [Myxococcota bacterium]|jgi:predicted amidophosphoribosyltransferase